MTGALIAICPPLCNRQRLLLSARTSRARVIARCLAFGPARERDGGMRILPLSVTSPPVKSVYAGGGQLPLMTHAAAGRSGCHMGRSALAAKCVQSYARMSPSLISVRGP